MLFSSGVIGVINVICCCDDREIRYNDVKTPVNLTTPQYYSSATKRLHRSYIAKKRYFQAMQLLAHNSWSTHPKLCYELLLHFITEICREDFLIAESLVERSLGSFYRPVMKIPDDVVISYRNQVRHLARKYFFTLIRNDKIDKAYLLACDIDEADLFRILLNIGEKRGMERLCAAVSAKLRELSRDYLSMSGRSAPSLFSAMQGKVDMRVKPPQRAPDSLRSSLALSSSQSEVGGNRFRSAVRSISRNERNERSASLIGRLAAMTDDRGSLISEVTAGGVRSQRGSVISIPAFGSREVGSTYTDLGDL